jgi:hypothetical protein
MLNINEETVKTKSGKLHVLWVARNIAPGSILHNTVYATGLTLEALRWNLNR